MDDALLVPEKAVADGLELHIQTVREKRRDMLVEGEHWQKKGREVCYTLNGLEILWRALAEVPEFETLEACEGYLSSLANKLILEYSKGKKKARLKNGCSYPVKITKADCFNTQVVRGEVDGVEVTLRVRDNRLLCNGMVVRGRYTTNNIMWMQAPHPRFRGDKLCQVS